MLPRESCQMDFRLNLHLREDEPASERDTYLPNEPAGMLHNKDISRFTRMRKNQRGQ